MSEGLKSAKHIVCRNIFKYGSCTRGETCVFAHSTDELVDIECKFSRDNKCSKGRTCKFKHVSETREQYHRRLNITFEKKKNSHEDNNKDVSSVSKEKQDDVPVVINIYDNLRYDSHEENLS